jgi:hypothetical protein
MARLPAISLVMPALVAGIHVFLLQQRQGVDGRDKPGHDEADENRLYLLSHCHGMT